VRNAKGGSGEFEEVDLLEGITLKIIAANRVINLPEGTAAKNVAFHVLIDALDRRRRIGDFSDELG